MLYCKSPGARTVLCYMAHILMEDRNVLVVVASTTRVSVDAERMAAVEMIQGAASVLSKGIVTVGLIAALTPATSSRTSGTSMRRRISPRTRRAYGRRSTAGRNGSRVAP